MLIKILVKYGTWFKKLEVCYTVFDVLVVKKAVLLDMMDIQGGVSI